MSSKWAQCLDLEPLMAEYVGSSWQCRGCGHVYTFAETLQLPTVEHERVTLGTLHMRQNDDGDPVPCGMVVRGATGVATDA